ncbi:MAG: signal peptidase I [Armatimonadota bacterium]|nr:signal peptidase I [Armatimonadota bacterium]MDR7485120.1 signal peptidase I [Armatimonadota bacterium]MDR7533508.1 signal peptidase I [Armatimonadota bacterium]MDR7536991.1 signal peptidase I [Armatimonadota bacterium]
MKTEIRTEIIRAWGALRRGGRNVRDMLGVLVVAVILAQLVMTSVAQAYQVEQSSMEPTLLPHDRVLVNKFIYRLREPRRGDVVVLRYPRDPGRSYIKRLVAGPGTRVEIRAGQLLIDDVPVQEVYVNGQPTGDWGPDVVPADNYFVLGDNRNNSEDSRAFGFLRREQIVGPAMLIYWPPHRMRLLRAR